MEINLNLSDCVDLINLYNVTDGENGWGTLDIVFSVLSHGQQIQHRVTSHFRQGLRFQRVPM